MSGPSQVVAILWSDDLDFMYCSISGSTLIEAVSDGAALDEAVFDGAALDDIASLMVLQIEIGFISGQPEEWSVSEK